MFCAPIKLSNRAMRPGDRDFNKYKSKLLDEKLYMKSDYYHSYTFRWDRSKKFIGTSNNTNHSVAVNNILLPENIPTFNTGSSLQRWSNKRPRLKSSKTKPLSKRDVSPLDVEVEDTFNVATLIKQFSQELEAEQEESQEFFEDIEEIDPDIQRLISISQSTSTDQDYEDGRNHRKKHKKKHRRDEKVKRTKTRTIRFSISKPPSPQTVQVIRVDVTSNYSLEEAEDSNKAVVDDVDCSKGCGKRIRNGMELKKAMLKKQFSIHVDDNDEVDILCKKLMLMERNDGED